jgi:hypothetical protein
MTRNSFKEEQEAILKEETIVIKKVNQGKPGESTNKSTFFIDTDSCRIMKLRLFPLAISISFVTSCNSRNSPMHVHFANFIAAQFGITVVDIS